MSTWDLPFGDFIMEEIALACSERWRNGIDEKFFDHPDYCRWAFTAMKRKHGIAFHDPLTRIWTPDKTTLTCFRLYTDIEMMVAFVIIRHLYLLSKNEAYISWKNGWDNEIHVKRAFITYLTLIDEDGYGWSYLYPHRNSRVKLPKCLSPECYLYLAVTNFVKQTHKIRQCNLQLWERYYKFEQLPCFFKCLVRPAIKYYWDINGTTHVALHRKQLEKRYRDLMINWSHHNFHESLDAVPDRDHALYDLNLLDQDDVSELSKLDINNDMINTYLLFYSMTWKYLLRGGYLSSCSYLAHTCKQITEILNMIDLPTFSRGQLRVISKACHKKFNKLKRIYAMSRKYMHLQIKVKTLLRNLRVLQEEMAQNAFMDIRYLFREQIPRRPSPLRPLTCAGTSLEENNLIINGLRVCYCFHCDKNDLRDREDGTNILESIRYLFIKVANYPSEEELERMHLEVKRKHDISLSINDKWYTKSNEKAEEAIYLYSLAQVRYLYNPVKEKDIYLPKSLIPRAPFSQQYETEIWEFLCQDLNLRDWCQLCGDCQKCDNDLRLRRPALRGSIRTLYRAYRIIPQPALDDIDREGPRGT